MDLSVSVKRSHAPTATITPPRTPTITTTSAHELLSDIQNISDKLSILPSLAPGEHVNNLLTQLVTLCISRYSPDFTTSFLSIPSVQNLCATLRPLCATAESELEKHWADKLLYRASQDSTTTQSLLHSFPYYTSYLDLSRLECSTLSSFASTPLRKFAFIGSGPLPLTSLCILDTYADATVHNIDRDAAALRSSAELCAALGYGARISFACEDVSGVGETGTETDWEAYEVVFLAALVGTDTHSKVEILASLVGKLRSGTLVVARSAWGVRSVLYPVLELSAELERCGLDVLVEVHPWTDVVNSVVVMRVRDK